LFQAGPGGTSGGVAAAGAGVDRAAGGQNPRDSQRTSDPADAARRRLVGGTGSGGMNSLDVPKHKSPGADEAITKDTVRFCF